MFNGITTTKGHFRGVPKHPHFQNEAKCATFLVKMSFICMSWALNLVRGNSEMAYYSKNPARKSLVV